jgi:hypothetical protein
LKLVRGDINVHDELYQAISQLPKNHNLLSFQYGDLEKIMKEVQMARRYTLAHKISEK